jgi:DNA-directed RNA polymerase alpha subunit
MMTKTVSKMSEEMLEIRLNLPDLASLLKKQITKLQELSINNMQPNGKALSLNHSKRQRKLRGNNKGGSRAQA